MKSKKTVLVVWCVCVICFWWGLLITARKLKSHAETKPNIPKSPGSSLRTVRACNYMKMSGISTIYVQSNCTCRAQKCLHLRKQLKVKNEITPVAMKGSVKIIIQVCFEGLTCFLACLGHRNLENSGQPGPVASQQESSGPNSTSPPGSFYTAFSPSPPASSHSPKSWTLG